MRSSGKLEGPVRHSDLVRELHLRRLPQAVHLEAAGDADHAARRQRDALLSSGVDIAGRDDVRLEARRLRRRQRRQRPGLRRPMHLLPVSLFRRQRTGSHFR